MGIMSKANIKLQLGLQKHYIQSQFKPTDIFLQSTLCTFLFSSWDFKEKLKLNPCLRFLVNHTHA